LKKKNSFPFTSFFKKISFLGICKDTLFSSLEGVAVPHYALSGDNLLLVRKSARQGTRRTPLIFKQVSFDGQGDSKVGDTRFSLMARMPSLVSLTARRHRQPTSQQHGLHTNTSRESDKTTTSFTLTLSVPFKPVTSTRHPKGANEHCWWILTSFGSNEQQRWHST
jgi:hypothetical protein